MRILLCIVTLAAYCAAQSAPPRKATIGSGTWWRNPDYALQLSLTPKQIEAMEKAFADHEARMVDINSGFQRENLKLDTVMRAKSTPEAELKAQIEKVAENRKQFVLESLNLAIGERAVLNEDQWKKFLEIRERAKYESQTEAPAPK